MSFVRFRHTSDLFMACDVKSEEFLSGPSYVWGASYIFDQQSSKTVGDKDYRILQVYEPKVSNSKMSQ